MSTALTAGFENPALLLGDPDAVQPGHDVLSLVIDALAHGLVVIDKRGKLIHANQVARAELKRASVLCEAGEMIQAAVSADNQTLRLALTKASSGKRSLINVAGGGLSIMVAVVPLMGEARSGAAHIALFLSRAEVCESGMFGFFARSYGLTQTEEHVLTILCRGLSTPEIALQLKVAVSTIRSHVRSLCAKTGSSGVRELVNRVAVLPPVAPCQLAQVH